MITLEAATRAGLEAGLADARVRHSHYYDAALHRVLTETGKVDLRASLSRIAASIAYRTVAADPVERPVADTIGGLLSSTGLGRLEEVGIDGEVVEIVLATSGLARARVEMFGPAGSPVCDVARGVLEGALGAVLDHPYLVEEVECGGAGGARCRFVGTPAPKEPPPTDAGVFQWHPRGVVPEPDPYFPDNDVLEPLFLRDDVEILLTGSTQGRLWAEVYARAAQEFEEEVPRVMGAKFANLPSVVLTEAAHLGTFYALGGLLRSAEWRELVAPCLPAREDWVHAIVALLDGFATGEWRVRLLAPEQRFTVHLHDGYEALSHQTLSGTASAPRCYFARGVVAAIMNVLYAGDIYAPESLSSSVYNRLFRSPLSFRAIETRCQAMGHPYCEFVANPLSPGLRLGQDLLGSAD